jgi:hypothetical protein
VCGLAFRLVFLIFFLLLLLLLSIPFFQVPTTWIPAWIDPFRYIYLFSRFL